MVVTGLSRSYRLWNFKFIAKIILKKTRGICVLCKGVACNQERNLGSDHLLFRIYSAKWETRTGKESFWNRWKAMMAYHQSSGWPKVNFRYEVRKRTIWPICTSPSLSLRPCPSGRRMFSEPFVITAGLTKAGAHDVRSPYVKDTSATGVIVYIHMTIVGCSWVGMKWNVPIDLTAVMVEFLYACRKEKFSHF